MSGPDPSSATFPSHPGTRTIFQIGQILGGTYEIRTVLGAGGMGQVFEAHDRVFDRIVAIKAAWGAFSPDQLRAEARALAAVRHTSMVAIHCMGCEDGIDYLVMERIYGVSLAEHIDLRAKAGVLFTVPEVIDILLNLGEGIGAIHQAGIAHRDITPQNVMLTPNGRIVIMDFGIFKPESSQSGDASLAGTPHYMAPEAILGNVAPGAGHLVDLYALGVIGYELLLGRVPFGGATVAEVMTRQVNDRPPDVAAARQGVPPALVDLLASLLSKEPQQRPNGVDDILWQLRTILAREDGRARGEPYSVLIVDDDPDIRVLIELFVRRMVPDADVRLSADGLEAISAVQQHPPHLMLLDLDMPRTNGIEVCMFLRGTHKADRTTVVLVSEKVHDHDLPLLRTLGIRHILRKGASLSETLSALLTNLRRRHY